MIKYSVGFQLYEQGEEKFSEIVSDYRDSISEVFFAWQDIPTGRSGVATRHGYTDWTAQRRTEEELIKIKQMGIKLDLLFNGNCYGKDLLSEKLANTVCNDNCLLNDSVSVHPKIAQGVILLKQSYLENIPIEVFAEKSNVSISTFRKNFKEQYGISPLQYRNRLRIDRATALLEDGSCTISEVAYASGFDNVGYFCKLYKQITGKTPKNTK